MHLTHVRPVVYSAIHPSDGKHPVDAMMEVAKTVHGKAFQKYIGEGTLQDNWENLNNKDYRVAERELYNNLNAEYQELKADLKSMKQTYDSSFLARQIAQREFSKRVEQFKDYL